MFTKKLLLISLAILLVIISLVVLSFKAFGMFSAKNVINMKANSSSTVSSSSAIALPSSAIVTSSSQAPVSKVTSSKKPATPKPPVLTYLNVKALPDNNIVSTISKDTINNDMVNLQAYIPSLIINLKYATTDNFTKQKIYNFNVAYLRRGTADKLTAANKELNRLGYSIEIWDAYRPPADQFKLWAVKHDATFIANPYTTHSNHSCGSAVDITLMKNGTEVVMPSNFDEFGLTADRNYTDVSKEAATNAKLLEYTMKKYGFVPYKNEWWHFDDSTKYAPITYDVNTKPVTTFDINAIGDCTLGNYYGVAPKLSFNYYLDVLKKPTTYFIQNFRNTFLNDDLTIANSENVFTNSTNRVEKPYQPTGEFWLSGRPSSVNIYKDNGIDAVSVANNHSLDYGMDEFKKSVGYLNNAGILTFGYGNYAIYQKNGIKVGLLSYNLLGPFELGVNETAIKSIISRELATMSKYTHIQIVSFHWGIECSNSYNAIQSEFAHFAIDNGADLVLGTHPHYIEPVENYKGRAIAYSLANFCYGGAVNSHNVLSFILNVKFKLNQNKEIVSSADSITPVITNDVPNNYCPRIAGEPFSSQIISLVNKIQ
jgi:D-alanyl-D-alanine dipeptidase